VPGNERVDQIAVAFAAGRKPSLYIGPLLKYDVAVHDLPENTEVPEMRPKAAKVAAYSYLSLVNGVAQRHSSWTECEARVKGRPGARFKKALSAEDEAKILQEWGVSLSGFR
jgi:ribonuclease HI